MSIGDDGGGAAEVLAQMNISKANLVDATGWLKYDMFPHGWLTDSTADFSKVPVIKYEIQAPVLREQSANVRYQLPAFEKLRAVRAPTGEPRTRYIGSGWTPIHRTCSQCSKTT